MKNNTKIIGLILAIIIIGALVYTKKHTALTPVVSQTSSESIVGCYVAHLSNDVYSLAITSQQGDNVKGTLVFRNADKDSSSGTFTGTYKDAILLADYSFNSEGMTSVSQVIFKKQGSDFLRGYGPVDAQGTHFTDLTAITYDQSYTFAPSTAVCATSASSVVPA